MKDWPNSGASIVRFASHWEKIRDEGRLGPPCHGQECDGHRHQMRRIQPGEAADRECEPVPAGRRPDDDESGDEEEQVDAQISELDRVSGHAEGMVEIAALARAAIEEMIGRHHHGRTKAQTGPGARSARCCGSQGRSTDLLARRSPCGALRRPGRMGSVKPGHRSVGCGRKPDVLDDDRIIPQTRTPGSITRR